MVISRDVDAQKNSHAVNIPHDLEIMNIVLIWDRTMLLLAAALCEGCPFTVASIACVLYPIAEFEC